MGGARRPVTTHRRSGTLVAAKQAVLRALWRDKMHVEPRALELSPRAVRDSFQHVWEPAERLMAQLEPLPLGLLRVWQSTGRGHVVFTHRASCYRPRPQPWRDTALESVCYFSVADLAQGKPGAMLALLNLLDHLLGSGAVEGEPWLSDGAGLTTALREVGVRFAQILTLGYGVEELGATTAHDYFAHTLWLYLRDRRRLNTIDPLVYKLYHRTLMREEFWPAQCVDTQ